MEVRGTPFTLAAWIDVFEDYVVSVYCLAILSNYQ